MSKLTPREKRTLIFGMGFLMIFSLVYWGLLPAWEEFEWVNTKLREAKRLYIQAVRTVRMERDYLEKYEAYNRAYQELKSHYYSNMGEKEAMIKFLAQVEEIAQKSGVNIISKNPMGINMVDGYKALKVNLTLKGTPAQLTELLLKIRNAPIAINVNRLRIDLDQRNRLLQIKMIVSTLLIDEEGDGDEG
ncbi:hypothetical protein BBF96_03725 [Anoxybacter fermentans]|uniref:General secretion pathway protein GspM n=1 Tax=Anoxybacter fermentans TaxID=1323375 RepID=A0A3Q9HPJ5_9FIRM|nr:GspMb/PilO family protein [Anoxybacter fermentans]AZR72571.1 hypothetical protein BBF96_03725 [Anoxybacter fermentans]